MVGLSKDIIKFTIAVYLVRVQRRMQNLQSLLEVIISVTLKMKGQVRVTWRTFCTIAQHHMVHTKVSEVYIHFGLMYTRDHIFPVLPIKYLIKNTANNHTV